MSRCTSRARARCRCAPSSPAPTRSARPVSSPTMERARTRCPGGPATSCTHSGGATSGCSKRASPAGTRRGIRWWARTSRATPSTDVRDLGELTRAAELALGWARARPGVSEVEVFVSANGALLTRLNYTSHVPCNGVEEPKSVESYGLGLQVVFDGRRVGFGSEPSDLSQDGVERAFDKARRSAVADPDFVSLPRPLPAPRTLLDYHDPALMRVSDERLVEAGWTIIGGALRTFLASSRLADLADGEEALRRLGLIIGGDVTMIQERMAIASTAMPHVQTDETTLITSFVTSMVEAHAAKGSGWSTGTRLDDFSDEAGGEAARAAIAALGGTRVPSGRYTVVFGRQPVADILNDLVLPACNAETFYASASPFLGRLGRRVASSALSIYDHGAMPGMMGSKGITCEGLPTGRTDLIREGVLTGCLSCWYETERLMRDPQRADKLATFLNNVAGVTKDVKGTIVWAADEVVYAPEIAVRDVRIDAIAHVEDSSG